MNGCVTREALLRSIRVCNLPIARATAVSTDADDAKPAFQGKSLMVITVISSPGTTPSVGCNDEDGVSVVDDRFFICIIACTTPCPW